MSDVVTDAKGRKLTLRKLNVLEQSRLLLAAGTEASANSQYMQLVMMAAMVGDIDGTPRPIPRNFSQIEGMISTIDDAGFAALQVNMERQVAELLKASEDAATGEVAKPDPLAASV